MIKLDYVIYRFSLDFFFVEEEKDEMGLILSRVNYYFKFRKEIYKCFLLKSYKNGIYEL